MAITLSLRDLKSLRQEGCIGRNFRSNSKRLRILCWQLEFGGRIPTIRCKAGASAVQNANDDGAPGPGKYPDSTTDYDYENDIAAFANSATETVVTVRQRPR